MIYYHHFQFGTDKAKCGASFSSTNSLVGYNYISLCNYLKRYNSDYFTICSICYPEVLGKTGVPAITTSTAYITKTKQKEYLGRLDECKYDVKTDMVERVYPKGKNGTPLAGCVSINPESAVAQAMSKLESDRKKTYYWDPYFCDGDWW